MDCRNLYRLLLLLVLCSLAAGCAYGPIILDAERNNVYVVGSVNEQVALQYEEGMTILDALSKAQFPHKDALKMRVRWVDKSGKIIHRKRFSYTKVVEGKTNNYPLSPGDIIVVYRNPIYVVLDFIERCLQPVRSLLSAPMSGLAAS